MKCTSQSHQNHPLHKYLANYSLYRTVQGCHFLQLTPAADPLGIVKGFYCQICIRCSFGVSALAVVRWVCNYQVLLTEACLSFAIFLHAAFYIHSINLLKHIVIFTSFIIYTSFLCVLLPAVVSRIACDRQQMPLSLRLTNLLGIQT